jgi:hypothetical protein
MSSAMTGCSGTAPANIAEIDAASRLWGQFVDARRPRRLFFICASSTDLFCIPLSAAIELRPAPREIGAKIIIYKRAAGRKALNDDAGHR